MHEDPNKSIVSLVLLPFNLKLEGKWNSNSSHFNEYLTKKDLYVSELVCKHEITFGKNNGQINMVKRPNIKKRLDV